MSRMRSQNKIIQCTPNLYVLVSPHSWGRIIHFLPQNVEQKRKENKFDRSPNVPATGWGSGPIYLF